MISVQEEKMKNTKTLVTCALMAALLCICGPLSVPIGPIPISLTNFALYFCLYILGTKNTTISYIVYLLLGLAGLPVFSGFSGGLAKIAGPTGGYLIGFIPMVIIAGLVMYKFNLQPVISVLAMIAATAVAYLLGTVWFVYQANCEWAYALSVCVIPFIPFDIAKMIIATILGKAVRIPLKKAGII